jgi:hypothetical protein
MLGATSVLCGVLAVAGCTDDPTTVAVGMACIPRDEHQLGFSGFSSEDVTIETVNENCPAESVCLVKSFRGRLSCPYGQTLQDMSLPTDDPRRCTVAKDSGTAVTVEVQPQLVQTAGNKGVYCSALCADAQGKRSDSRSYHDCPSGFHCELLTESLLITSQNIGGSYCIRNDDPTKITLATSNSCLLEGDGSGTCGTAKPYP